MIKYAHRIGAIFYVLWGIFHGYVGVLLLQKVFAGGTYGALAVVGSALPASAIPQINSPITNGIIEHYAWNLVWFGAYAIIVALTLNWKNSKTGYWFNLSLVSLTDIGFIMAIVLPGYISAAAGWSGPVLWVLAVIFSTIGIMKNPEPQISI